MHKHMPLSLSVGLYLSLTHTLTEKENTVKSGAFMKICDSMCDTQRRGGCSPLRLFGNGHTSVSSISDIVASYLLHSSFLTRCSYLNAFIHVPPIHTVLFLCICLYPILVCKVAQKTGYAS